MSGASIRHIVIGILAVFSQIVLFRHLRIMGATPDIVLIFLVWIMASYTRTSALFFAAALGLFMDALLDLWGLNMFAKVAMVMACYNLIPNFEDSRPQTTQIFAMLLFIAFFHNLMLLLTTVFSQSLATWDVFWQILLGNTVFTAVIGMFLYIFKSDKG